MRAASPTLPAPAAAIQLVLLMLVAACRAPEPGTPVGVSTAVPEAPAAAAAETPRVVWADFAAARAWPAAAPPTRALVHRRDGALIHVRVEPAAFDAYRALAVESPMPEGARVMAWHESLEGQLLGGYLLEKRRGAWRASEIDAQGALVPGDGAACIRCHDMAPTDHLFGLGAPVEEGEGSGGGATPAAPPAGPRESDTTR